MYELKRCASEHLVEVASLNMEVQRLHAERHPELFKSKVNEEALIQMFSTQLQDENQHIQVATHNQKVIGYIWSELIEREESLLTHSIKRLKIHHISVAEEYRNTGAGRILMEATEDLAGKLSVTEIVLDVWCFNDSAINFFSLQNFKAFNVNMWKSVYE